MKKTVAILLTMVMTFSLAACGSSSSETGSSSSSSAATSTESSTEESTSAEETQEGYAGGEYLLRLAHHWNDTNVGSTMVENFVSEVESLSDGKITIEVHGNSELGNLADNSEALRMGTIDIAATDCGNLANVYPKAQILNMPYMFNDWDHAYAFLETEEFSGLVDEIADASNVRLLCVCGECFRKIFSQEKIETPDDINGMKVRVPDTAIYVKTLTAMGASPVAVPWGEVYTALQTGIVNAFENSYNGCYSNALYEQTHYIADSKHLFTDISLGVSMATFNDLDSEAQQVLIEAGHNAALKTRELIKNNEESDKQICLDKGMEYNEVDMDAFRATVSSVWEEYASSVDGGQELIDYIQNMTY